MCSLSLADRSFMSVGEKFRIERRKQCGFGVSRRAAHRNAAEGCDESHRVRKKMRISSDTVNQETESFTFPHQERNTEQREKREEKESNILEAETTRERKEKQRNRAFHIFFCTLHLHMASPTTSQLWALECSGSALLVKS
jgi:hypothetical protein